MRRNLFSNPGAVGLESALFQRVEVAIERPEVADMVYEQSQGRKGRKKRKRKLRLHRDDLDE